MEDLTLSVTSIITSLSGLIIAFTIIFGFFKRTRSWFANKLAESITLKDIDSKSDVGKGFDFNDGIKEDVDIVNKKLTTEVNRITTCIDKKFNTLSESILDVERSLLRLEIVTMIDHDPTQDKIILQLYDKYKGNKYKGNSYIDFQIDNWKKQYASKEDTQQSVRKKTNK
jgi:hypothetical protein